MAVASTSTHESPLENLSNIPHQSDHENDEEQARQFLLEHSESSEHDDDSISLYRPSIRLKRISQADAERYKPLAWVTNESSSSDETDDDDEFNIKIRTRSTSSINKTEKCSTKTSNSTKKSSHKKTNDIFINYNSSPILDEQSNDDSSTMDQDISPVEQVPKNIKENKNNESVFSSLNITQDKPMEISVNEQETENVINDVIDEESTQESSEER